VAINNKIKVPVVGSQNRSVLLNPQATEGATFGTDLFFSDGKTVVTLQNLAAALGVTKQSAQPTVLWNQLAAIPPNVIQVANLSTAGIVRRLPDGTWITQPPTDFTSRPGPPGRAGRRGPPGIPGAPGANGTAGSRGADGISILRPGPRGKQGFRGPQGERGATGAQGPAGTASTASGFPGYRQARPRPRVLPPLDNSATPTWSRQHRFAYSAGTAILIGTNVVNANPLGGTDAPHLFDLVNDNTANQVFRMSSYGAAGSIFQNNFHCFRANGTLAAPTATLSGDIFWSMGSRGYGTTGPTNSAADFSIAATENFSDTANGIKFTFAACPKGSVTRQDILNLSSNGSVFASEVQFTFAGGAGSTDLLRNSVLLSSTLPILSFKATGSAADAKYWEQLASGNVFVIQTISDDLSTTSNHALQFTRSGAALTDVALGNATNNNSFTFLGTGASTFTGKVNVNGDSNALIVKNSTPTAVVQLSTVLGWVGSGSTTDAAIGANGTLNIYATGSGGPSMAITSSTIKFLISNVEAFTVNATPTTGTQNPSGFTNNKPGSTSGGPASWLGVTVGGTQRWIPLYPN